ncbi:MAG: MBL fold metallo-hydrolase [Saprospiraceae bacterium]|nr:MBL fold metallo-hydrolase [Saprospiraceae bacterium]
MLLTILAVIAAVPLSALIIGRAISAPLYKGAVSDHFDGKQFFNPSGHKARGLSDVLKWQSDQKRVKKPWKIIENPVLGDKPTPSVSSGEVRVTYVGHSTVLVQMDGINILTDPVWYNRTSPVQWAGPKRVRPAGIKMEDLPPIHLILQSHNHWDHLDIVHLPKIYAQHKPLVVTSLGVSQFLNKYGIEKTVDMDWWDTHTFKKDNTELTITCVPAQHFSGRGTKDRNATLWSGFVVSSPQSGHIYFAGDSGYATFFKSIGEKFGKIRLALIPIGAYKPEWFMSAIHCSPSEAVQIHLDVNAEQSLAIHHSTFPLADDGQNEPIEELEKALILRGLSNDDFFVLEEGQYKTL